MKLPLLISIHRPIIKQFDSKIPVFHCFFPSNFCSAINQVAKKLLKNSIFFAKIFLKVFQIIFLIPIHFFPGTHLPSSFYHLMELKSRELHIVAPNSHSQYEAKDCGSLLIFSVGSHILWHIQQGAIDCGSLLTFSVGSHILWLPTHIFSMKPQIVALYSHFQ